MRYTPNDCKVSENSSWQDETADITSSTVLLDGENQTLLADDSASSQWGNKPFSSGAKDNADAESSSIVESKCSHTKSSPKTHKTCTVPPVMPHNPPSDCESDQNPVPSSEQSQSKKSSTKLEDSEPQSLPFSVNAFLSPLSGPRFSQSSNPDLNLEPT